MRWLQAHSLPIFYAAFVAWGRLKPKGIYDKSMNCEGATEAAPHAILTIAGERKKR